MTTTKCQNGEKLMYKNKASSGTNNICGRKIRELREGRSEKTSQRKLAELLQVAGIDLDKNAIQRIECGKRYETDIELKVIAKVLEVSYQTLLDD